MSPFRLEGWPTDFPNVQGEKKAPAPPAPLSEQDRRRPSPPAPRPARNSDEAHAPS